MEKSELQISAYDHHLSPIVNAMKNGETEYWDYRNRNMTEVRTSLILESMYQLIMFNSHIVPLSTLNTILMRTWHQIPNDDIGLSERIMFWKCLTNLYNLGLGEELFIEELKKHGYAYPLDRKEYADYFKTVAREMVFAETWSNRLLMIDEVYVKEHADELKDVYLECISSYFHYNRNRPNSKVPEIHEYFKDVMKYCSSIPFAKHYKDIGLIIAMFEDNDSDSPKTSYVLIDNQLLDCLCHKEHGDVAHNIDDRKKFWEVIYKNRFSEIDKDDFDYLRKDKVMLAVWY